MHLVNVHQQKRNQKYFWYANNTFLLYSAVKSVKHGLFFISNGIFDQNSKHFLMCFSSVALFLFLSYDQSGACC